MPLRTLERWRYTGAGPRFLKLGTGGPTSPVRYRLVDLEAWLAERARRSTADNGRASRASAPEKPHSERAFADEPAEAETYPTAYAGGDR